jgi:hypothetical protein
MEPGATNYGEETIIKGFETRELARTLYSLKDRLVIYRAVQITP